MPQPVKRVYQPRGRKHLEYIKRMAMRIWADTYGCREDGDGVHWRQSLKDAMTLHRNYLKTGFKIRPASFAAISVGPPKDEGSYWHDPQTGLWMPLILN